MKKAKNVKKIVEKSTGEVYASKKAIKKHEGMESKAMQKKEKKMSKKGRSFKSMVK